MSQTYGSRTRLELGDSRILANSATKQTEIGTRHRILKINFLVVYGSEIFYLKSTEMSTYIADCRYEKGQG